MDILTLLKGLSELKKINNAIIAFDVNFLFVLIQIVLNYRQNNAEIEVEEEIDCEESSEGK